MKLKLLSLALLVSSTLCLNAAPSDKKLEIVPYHYLPQNQYFIKVNEPGHVFISHDGGVSWEFVKTFYYTPNYFVTTNNFTNTLTLFKHTNLNTYH